MARKASRRMATIGPVEPATPSSHRELQPEEVSERPFLLVKSSDLKTPGSAPDGDGFNVFNEAPVEIESHDFNVDENVSHDFNDFIECLGYPPPGAEKRVERRDDEVEEFNDFIECLGYPPPRKKR